MTRVIVDEALLSKLLNLSQPLELCNASGKVLARLLPTFDPSLYENLEPNISKEELERRRQNKGKTYSTAEVLAYLEKL
jgi:hypothetical protein